MSQSIRQSELFAAQDWTALYRAFTSINFNAYDFDSISQSMRDYIRINYPEDFNDWIESSEFVALIDLLAYLGSSLAFRTDINARENFLDTAERRESIIRLARFLSYNPRRNFPGRGLVKIKSISVNDDILDSNGNSLNNIPIQWDDVQNPDWFEQWVTVMNSTLIPSNPFGQPLKPGVVGGVRTHLYRVNSILRDNGGVYPFTAMVDGRNQDFEIVNLDFEDNGTFFERMPNPLSAFHMSYRNDGNGNSSPDTGFYLYFKQGRLQNQIFDIQYAVENRVIDVPGNDVNELDVWVQSVDEEGYMTNGGAWTKVQTIQRGIPTGNNITFNDIPPEERNIYQVVTRDNDQISLRFSDGRFGNIPTGKVRCWYRQSSGLRYVIRPQDMSNIQIRVPYVNQFNLTKELTITFGLQVPVSNSVPRESDEDIKRRAPQVYYTQNRMVTGEDYNVFPIQNNLARKIKAVNRTYSGHSRYIDLNDPTGTYQNVNVFGDDGLLYRMEDDQYFEVMVSDNVNRASVEIMSEIIQPFVSNLKMRNFIQDQYLRYPDTYETTPNAPPYLTWRNISNSANSSTGYFHITSDPSQEGTAATLGASVFPVAPGASDPTLTRIRNLLAEGSIVKFQDGQWAKVETVIGDGAGQNQQQGRVSLAENIVSGLYVEQVLPAYRTNFTTVEYALIQDQLQNRRTFGLGYDYRDGRWYIIEANKLRFNDRYDYTTKDSNSDSSWLLLVEHSADTFRVTARGLLYVFESEKDVRFYNYNQYKTYNKSTGQMDQDFIRVLGVNETPSFQTTPNWKPMTSYRANDTVRYQGVVYRAITNAAASPVFVIGTTWLPQPSAIGSDLDFGLVSSFTYRDGYVESRRIQVGMYDSDQDGVADNPENFYQVVGVPTATDAPQYLFWEKYQGIDNYEYYSPLDDSAVYRVDGAVSKPVSITTTRWVSLPYTVNFYNLAHDDRVLLPRQTNSDERGVYRFKVNAVGVSINALGQETDYLHLTINGTSYDLRVGLPGDSAASGTVWGLAKHAITNSNYRVRMVDANYMTNPVIGSTILFESIDPMAEVKDVFMTEAVDRASTVTATVGDRIYLQGQFRNPLDGLPTPDIVWDHSNGRFWAKYIKNNQITYELDSTNRFRWYVGRRGLKFHWKHFAPRDHRIDPSVSNIIDIFVLTQEYDTLMRQWVRTGGRLEEMPVPPSELDLSITFKELEDYKMFSDEMVWRPVQYKLLFGDRAPEELRARFKVVKVPGTTLSDGEIKSQIIRIIDNFFQVNRWDFGLTFYASELIGYIHQQMANSVASVVLVPQNEDAGFGNLFEVPCLPNEMFLSVARVTDVDIIAANTQTNLRIKT